MMKTRFFTFITSFIFLFINGSALAKDNINIEGKAVWYTVEYIIFENNPLSNQQLEPWAKDAFQMPENSIELDSLSKQKAFSLLSVEQQQLHGVYKRLQTLSSYTPIAHGGWLQPLKEKEKLKPIQINYQAGATQLEGTLTFHRGRYLHLDIDLQLSDMVPSVYNENYVTNPVIQPATLYRLKETRRIKASDSHYFDHPRFGILTIVEKIDSPETSVSTTDLIEEQTESDAIEIKSPGNTALANEN